ncbi:hypothetical protein J437_LFUL015073 [Ladona fulva]|uniref:Zinc finger ZPR1-type domain-containing protein n=1 Tax=Ladona fulva TaxID=123851 RepID=A0A8K0KHB4_LADFU|nr:hypothetical protein J437_LFUL015073 [Ladona fulva]
MSHHQAFAELSDTCSLYIPELELEMGATTLGGRFSTIEGLLSSIKEQLEEKGMIGDSMIPGARKRYLVFLEKLDKVLQGKKPVTIILDDPAGNSYIQDVIIMSTSCDKCGHRTNEVKSGGGVEPKGLKIEVKVNGSEDFCRDVLKRHQSLD